MSTTSISDGTNTYVFNQNQVNLLTAMNVQITPGTNTRFQPGQYTQLISLFNNNGAFAANTNGTSQVSTSLSGLTAKIAYLTQQIGNKVDKVKDDTVKGKILFEECPKTDATNDQIDTCDKYLITKHYADAHYMGVPLEFKGEWESSCRSYTKGAIVYYKGSSFVSIVDDNESDIEDECAWHLFAKKGKTPTFRGEWDSCVCYDVSDIVTFNGSSFISMVKGNKKSLEDTHVWAVLAQGGSKITWVGEWETGSLYSYFDIVSYEGSSYISLKSENGDSVTAPESWGMVAKAARGFVFRGVYSSESVYSIDDVVSYNNKIYRSLTGNNVISVNDVVTSDWQLMIAAPKDGKSFNFLGEYDADTSYAVDDVVTFVGSTYINTIADNKNNPLLLVGWSVLAKSGKTFTFRGAWSAETRYFQNDLVTYEGTTYIALKTNLGSRITCENSYRVLAQAGSSFRIRGSYDAQNVYDKFDVVDYNGSSYVYSAQVSSSALPVINGETDTEHWQLMAAQSKINFGGEYASGSYRLGTVVSYKGSSYVSLMDNNTVAPLNNQDVLNSDNWGLLAQAGVSVTFVGNWNSEASYSINDVVYFGGGSYVSKINNNTDAPVVNGDASNNWQIISRSGDINYAGVWEVETSYAAGKVVYHEGSSYLSLRDDNTDEPGSDTCKWTLLSKVGRSILYKGDWDHCDTYATGEIVSFGGSSYISLKDDNDGYIFDTQSWSLLAKRGEFMQYKGRWRSNREYSKWDVVVYKGSSYISRKNGNDDEPSHSSDEDDCDSKWGLVAAGSMLNYKGNFTDSTHYNAGDIVVYEGSSYVALECVNSAIPTDDDFWGLVAAKGSDSNVPGPQGSTGSSGTNGQNGSQGPQGLPGQNGQNGTNGQDGVDAHFDWQGEWSSSDTYSEHQIVYYNGSSYISLVNNNSSTPNDSSDWNMITESGSSPTYEGNWDHCREYSYAEIVRYNGRSYISTTNNNNDNKPGCNDEWGLLNIDGPKFVGVFESDNTYDENDVVRYHGSAYISTSDNNSTTPGTDDDEWRLLLEKSAMNVEGEYDPIRTYDLNDVVTYKGSSYISTESNNDSVPSDCGGWKLIAAKGAGINIVGNYDSGDSYDVNDVVYYNGSSYVSKINNNSAHPTDSCEWQMFARSGAMKYLGQWENDRGYDKEDVVQYNGTSYISTASNNHDVPNGSEDWDVVARRGKALDPSGTWDSEDTYDVNDMVYYKGSSYVSKNDDNTSEPTDIEQWQLVSKGLTLTGKWNCETTYSINDTVEYHGASYASIVNVNTAKPTDCDVWQTIANPKLATKGEWCECETYWKGEIVEYCGSSYVANTNNNSAIPTDSEEWDLLAKAGRSVLFKGEWYGSGNYKKGDLVAYLGSTYVALSDDNCDYPTDTESWHLIAKEGSLQYRGAYSSEVHYALGDTVYYQGSSYISKVCDNTDSPNDEDTWGLVAKAGTSFVFRGPYSDITYAYGDVVSYEGTIYLSNMNGNTYSPPSESWTKLVEGGTTIHYRGTFNVETQYYINDIVSYLGSTYISIQLTDGSPIPTETSYWQLIAKGAEIKYNGEFNHERAYQLGDVVYYRGSSYISRVNDNTTSPPSSCNNNEGGEKWGLLARQGSGFNFKGKWNCEKKYITGDLVVYKGTTYICLTDCGCSSSNPSESDAEKWSVFASAGVSMKFEGKWRCDYEYSYYDVVFSKGDLYLSLKNCNDNDLDDTDSWTLMVNNETWRGIWNDDRTYNQYDLVHYDGSTYISNTDNNTSIPTDSEDWSLFASSAVGMNYIGNFSQSETYSYNQVVTYNGSSFVSKVDNNTAVPTDSEEWGVVATSFGGNMNYKGQLTEDEYNTNDVMLSEGRLYISKVNGAYTHGDLMTNPEWENIGQMNGLVWQSTYSERTYHANDMVKYEGGIYVSKENNNTANPTDSDEWDTIVEPQPTSEEPYMIYRGEWVGTGHNYFTGDVVHYDGVRYVCIADNNTSLGANGKWEVLVPSVEDSMKWRGTYTDISYEINNVVAYNGSSYVSTSNDNTSLPTDTSNWDVVASSGGSSSGSSGRSAMSASNSSSSIIAVVLGGTLVPLPNNQDLDGFTVDGTNTIFTVVNTGKYMISYGVATTTDLLISSRVMYNGASIVSSDITPVVASRIFNTQFLCSLSADDTLSLQLYGVISVATLLGGNSTYFTVVQIA